MARLFSIVTIFALLAVTFNNCSPGFKALDALSSTSTSFESPSGSHSDGREMLDNASMYNVASRASLTNGSTISSQDCQIQGNFPMRTHYKAGVGPAIGATDLEEIWNPTADVEIKNGARLVKNYASTVPSHNHYIADNYDSNKYSDEEVRKSLRLLCSSDVSQIRFIQLDKEITSQSDLTNALVQNSPSYQVLHGLVFRKNMFTIVVPPMWNASKGYATLINGFYSLNQNVVELVGPTFFQALREAYKKDKKGAVAIFWNGQGAIASRTTNNAAYVDFNDFMKLTVPALGLDRNKGITAGGSRGGVTAINLAAHPAVDQIRIAFTHSVVPPSDLPFIASLTTPTVPLLLTASDWSTGYVGSWSLDFRMPDGVTTGAQQHIKVLGGSNDADYLRQNINLTAPTKMAKLVRNNTSVLLEIGSHDFIVPFVDQYQLFQTYKKNNVRVEARVNYFSGHYGYPNVMDAALLQAVLALNSTTNPMTMTFVEKGKKLNFKAVPDKDTQEPYNLSYTDSPLTVEFPKFVINNSTPQILATGVPGKRYTIVAKDSLGKFHIHTMVINDNGISVTEFDRDSLPEGVTKLIAIFEVDANYQLLKKINYISNVKNNPPIEVIRYTGTGEKDPVRLGREVPNVIMETIFGANFVNTYSPMLSTNYGILETGTEIPTLEEKTFFGGLIAPQTPGVVPASFSCSPSGTLASYSMGASITVSSAHKNIQGHYFVAGKLTDGTWLTYANGVWQKYDGSAASTLTVSSGALNQFSTTVFTNSNLTDYPGGEVHIGYGVGASKSAALDNMLAQENQHKLCATLPQNTPATYSCTGSGTLASYSLSGRMEVDSKAKFKPGYYFVAAYVPTAKVWHTMDQNSQWKLYDGSEGSINGIQSSSLNVYAPVILNNAVLDSSLAGVEVHFGYSTGTNKKAAFDNMLNLNQHQLCKTLPTK